MELCWNYCFSRSIFRAWKTKYGEAIADDAGRPTRLELENVRLRKALARAICFWPSFSCRATR
jgi:hypothetical protein